MLPIVSGCGSSASDAQRFTVGARAACANYVRALKHFDHSISAQAGERNVALSTKASEDWLHALRPLVPPRSSGVSTATWRHDIEVQIADERAVARFYKAEFPKLLASFKHNNPTPKLPPGTGPTAATLAQAFNSAEGRRFLRLEKKLTDRTTVHAKAWARIAKRVGLLTLCRAATKP